MYISQSGYTRKAAVYVVCVLVCVCWCVCVCVCGNVQTRLEAAKRSSALDICRQSSSTIQLMKSEMFIFLSLYNIKADGGETLHKSGHTRK